MLRKYAVLLLALGISWAEEPQKPASAKFYRLDFVIQEVDGAKVLNSRTYSATAATGGQIYCSLRTSSDVRVPIPNSSQYITVSVGVSIDAGRLVEIGNELTLEVSADVSSLPEESIANASPILRKNNWKSTLLIPLKKATVIFSSDDLASKRKMQMVLTATPVQ